MGCIMATFVPTKPDCRLDYYNKILIQTAKADANKVTNLRKNKEHVRNQMTKHINKLLSNIANKMFKNIESSAQDGFSYTYIAEFSTTNNPIRVSGNSQSEFNKNMSSKTLEDFISIEMRRQLKLQLGNYTFTDSNDFNELPSVESIVDYLKQQISPKFDIFAEEHIDNGNKMVKIKVSWEVNLM